MEGVTMSKLPLDGIRVADFTQVLQGPFATVMLAQMGAEVIKIETGSRTVSGSRSAVGSPAVSSGRNASKKSLTLNLKDPRGTEVAKSLVKISHIAVENFATGVMERLGLGYEDLRKVKPGIVMLSSQGLGRTGPLKDAIGFGSEFSNFAGLSYLTSYKNGLPGLVGSQWTDHLTGMTLVFTLLAALHHTQETGEGQYIQVSMAETVIATIPEQVMDFTVNGRHPGPQENQEAGKAPHNVYRSQGLDRWVAIAVTNEEEWIALCQATVHPEWAADERFADPVSRWRNQDELDRLVTRWTLERTDYEAMHILQGAGVPAGPILNAAGLVDDPHLKERGSFITMGEEEGSPEPHVAHPWRSNDVPQPLYKPGPKLGEDNDYVLKNLLGMSEESISELKVGGVLE
jgi:benzylsuccinate CoA-transferase BbsF subunit